MAQIPPPSRSQGTTPSEGLQPDDPRLQGALQTTTSSLLLRSAIDGFQQAINESKEASAKSKQEIREIYGN